ELIANRIADVLDDINNLDKQRKIAAELKELANQFIIYDKATF
ncbi:MAG: serine hydroxymethyltransferase, partial [Campylobacter lanienae]|nr:serine hydroxymethyltransferase [Campylobacter lanienae]